MDIRAFRAVVRARDFDRTADFYGGTLALPRLHSWDRADGRGARYQAGSGVIEVLGRPRTGDGAGRDENYDFQGPKQKMTLTLEVPSAERVYEELIFRDKNIPGGLRRDANGSLVFETHDPDGVKLLFVEQG